jgi:hypothetical protein
MYIKSEYINTDQKVPGLSLGGVTTGPGVLPGLFSFSPAYGGLSRVHTH